MKYELPKLKLIFSVEEALAIAKFEEIKDELEGKGIDPFGFGVVEILCNMVEMKNTRVEEDELIIEIKD